MTYPDQLIPLHISLTPLVSCPKVGTFGYQDHQEKRYSAPDTGSQLRRLVDGRSQRPGSHRTTSPLARSQKIPTQAQTSSPIKSGGLWGASGTVCVQGFVQNSPFSHTLEVMSPPCRVTKDGRSFSNKCVPSGKASGVAFETIGVALACA